jgi:hypothetical protein
MDSELFALIVIVGWNLFILWIALKMKKMSDNYTDSIGGDSRIKNESIVRKVYDTVVDLHEINKRDQQMAENIRRNRGKSESER